MIRGLKGAAMTAGMAVSLVAISAGFASAQDLEEIVVTARSRAESVQSVPLAITAFSSDDMDKRAVVDMKDISRLTPGFAFEDFGGTGNTSPVIRGATQIAGSTEQPVSFFVDGVYLPRSYVTDIGFWGIDRLEVVKGPQSARYGRNAFSGAVNYVTRKPSATEFQAELEGTAGIYGRYDLAGLMSVPIIKDKLAVLGGVSHSEFDGSWENTHPYCDIGFNLGTNCRVGGYEKLTYNAAVRFTPTDRLTIDASYFDISNKREQPATTYFGELNSNSGLLNCGQYNPNVRPASAGGTGAGGQWFRLYCGQLPVNPLAVDPRGYGGQLDATITRVAVNYKITDAVSLDYVYGRVRASNTVNFYNDQIPGCTYFLPGQCVFSSVGIAQNLSEQHDARLTFDNGGMFRFSVGYLYSPTQDFNQNAFAAAAQLTTVPSQALMPSDRSGYSTYVVLGTNITKNEISSPFAEVSVNLMDDRLRLSAEGRYTREKRFQQALANAGGSGVLAASGLAFNETYTFFTPRFTADFNLTPDSLLYASVAKGVKSGGFNPTAFQPQYRVYQGDKNWTYELGTKNSFGKLRLNANLFLIKWSNMQIPASDPGNPAVLAQVITLNLGNLTSKGVELEAAYAVNSKFTVQATGYYGRATYDDGTFHLNYARTPAVCDNVVCPTNGDISGNLTPRAPEWMATLSGEWRDALTANVDYYLRGDVSYQSKAYADEMNLAWAQSRAVVNSTIGVQNDNYEFQFWVRNLLDKKYLAVASIQQPNVAYTAALGDRRTVGVTLKLRR